MTNKIKKKNYNQSVKDVFTKLKTSKKGLTEKDAEKRLKKDGKNQLPQRDAHPAWQILLSQFRSPLVVVILTAMFFSFLIGHWTDAFFIVFVVLINAIVGFIQESKAEKVLSQLSKSVKFYCKVVRSGRKKEILSENVVRGDIIVIEEGDKIPADGRIVETNNLTVNESSLTGEWLAVRKNSTILKGEASLGDRKNVVFMGGIVESGSGSFVATDIGIKTELGKISQMVKNEESPKTPLQKKFLHISKLMVIFILSIIGVFATVYIIRGEKLYDVFITSIALVVSAIPEGLLPAITVVLVFAMRRLAKKKALVRKLNATESMGSVSVICMDKTGTLTRGDMQVSHILTGDSEILEKESSLNSVYNLPGLELQSRVLEIATLVNDAYVEDTKDEFSDWIIHGRHTDSALLRAGLQAGIDKDKLERKFKLIKTIGFNSVKKYAVRIYQTKKNKATIFCLGAPEVVTEKCKNIQLNDKVESISSMSGKKLTGRLSILTRDGLRVLACAWKEIEIENINDFEKFDWEKAVEEMNLVGFIAMKDPLRKSVRKSLQIANQAGIKTVVITGDHRNTTQAITNELGLLVHNSEIVNGNDIDKLSDKQLEKNVKKIKIFARVSPEHKIRIVKAFQKNGEVVAMVGDGVNDAPALKASDIGIAVGTGTDIAKEVADIVLLDSSFSVIIKAIEQGRLVRENIKRVVIYLIADDFSELFLFFFALIIGLPFPLHSVQILWINLVEDSFPNIALTTENNTKGIMLEKPAKFKDQLLNGAYKKFMVAIFLVTSLAASLVFYFSYKITGDLENARTMAFVLIAFDSLAFAYVVKSFRQSIFSREIFSNRWLNWSILLSLLFLLAGIYVPFLQEMLRVSYMGWVGWIIIVGISLLEILILDFFKYILIIKKQKNKAKNEFCCRI